MMVLYSLEHTTESVRGLLTRHLFEIRPGVFVGRVSSTVKKLLTAKVIEEDPLVDMIIAEEKRGDLVFESYGCPTRRIADIEGMTLIGKKTGFVTDSFLEWFLAKPNKQLLTHLYETGITAKYLLNESIMASVSDWIALKLQISNDEATALCSYLAAMHDIGKVAPQFQRELREDLDVLKKAFDLDIIKKGYRHELYSAYIMKKYVNNSGKLSDILMGHHQGNNKGFKAASRAVCPPGINGNTKWDDNVIIPLLAWINERFPVSPDTINSVVKYWENSLLEIFTGVVMLSDWIASGTVFSDTNPSASDYYTDIRKRLDNLCCDNNISRQIFNLGTYKQMFNIIQPRPLQEIVEKAIDEDPRFLCMFIEAPTGEGKTEAGLYAALNAINESGKGSLYVALPTGATSEAMIGRVNSMLHNLDIPYKARLITGTSWLKHSDNTEHQREADLVFRKMKLLSPVAVGTVDQIMTAVQNTFYNEMKLLLLSSKVILIDEIHSYDSYMLHMIKQLLKYFKEYRVPVILMSATLSMSMKHELLSIYDTNPPEQDFDYPMVTVCRESGIKEYKCISCQEGKKYSIDVVDAKAPEIIYKEAVQTAGKGACVGIIANTVRVAMDTYRGLKELDTDDIDLYFIHARMPIRWKEKRTQKLISLFGKDRKNRPQKAIVVATSILEMSVDIDLDCLYTYLAPSDILLQRFGRVCRHADDGTAREQGFIPFIKILDAGEFKPYDEQLIKKSKEVLGKYKQVSIPTDIRKIVDDTYSDIKALERKTLANIKRASWGTIEDPDEKGMARVYLPNKMMDFPTRFEEYETISVFMGTDEELDIIKRNDASAEEYAEIYSGTVVSLPKPSFSGDMALIEEGSVYFEDVYDGRKYFTLDSELGLIMKDVI